MAKPKDGKQMAREMVRAVLFRLQEAGLENDKASRLLAIKIAHDVKGIVLEAL